MDPRYRDAIDNASANLSHALLEDILALLAQGLRRDALVRDLLRALGLALLSALYQGLCTYVVEQATARGLTVQSRPLVRFKTLFGEVEIESPSLRSSQSGASARPMKNTLGVEGEHSSEAVQRALVDCGSEKSFARAAVSFREHYGWDVGRTTLRNRTLEAAQEAASSIDLRLQEATRPSGQGIAASPGVDTMLLELDGCEMRTGVSMTAVEAGCRIGNPTSGCGWRTGAMSARDWPGLWTRRSAWWSVAWRRMTRSVSNFSGWPVRRA
jgi:hypothetical protein